ncbi:hypothetical protein [Streptomyces catenulae]|uniref:Secreted protein n=1 Tax=Streptomyces catenulae TaxID=66875 RepID=A0ABV2YZQ8_9ACTN|nr:hypothetical protein [Streptomyces catenulae]
MSVLGLTLLVLGLVTGITALWAVGAGLSVVGAALHLAEIRRRAVGKPRRHYW